MSAHLLDNPVFSALGSMHAHLARVHGTARAYLQPISPFMGAERLDAQGWSDLAALDSSARLIRDHIGPVPESSEVTFSAGLRQMIAPVVADFPRPHSIRPLTDTDVDAMLDLTERTRPGPFRERTIDFGGYRGIFTEIEGAERLMAMAGRRMRLPGYCEISAVCTDPAFVRKGAAAQLTRTIAAEIHAEGDDAFLHVSDQNPTAGLLYESLGFSVRARLEVAAVQFRTG